MVNIIYKEGENMNDRQIDIRQAKKLGKSTVYLVFTDFADDGKFYKLQKVEKGILVSEVET